MMQYFNIQVASQVSGVTSATIRAWEKRYNSIIPERAPNGHRLYSNDDIQKLSLLSKLTEVGHNIGKIAHLELQELKRIHLQIFGKSFEYKRIHYLDSGAELHDIDQNIRRGLQGGSSLVVGHELDKALLTSSPEQICNQLILPLLHKIQENGPLQNLISFFLGKIIWDKISQRGEMEEVIIYSGTENQLLTLVLGIHFLQKGFTPYFIRQDEGEISYFSHQNPALKVFSFIDLSHIGISVVKIPSEIDSFLDFVHDLKEAQLQRRHLH